MHDFPLLIVRTAISRNFYKYFLRRRMTPKPAENVIICERKSCDSREIKH